MSLHAVSAEVQAGQGNKDLDQILLCDLEKSINNFCNKVPDKMRPFLKSTIGHSQINWLVDTGAIVSCMGQDVFNSIDPTLVQQVHSQEDINLNSATGHSFKILGKFTIQITFDQHTLPHDVIVVNKLSVPAILGMDFLDKYNARIDAKKREIHFNSVKHVYAVSEDKEILTAECSHIPPRSARWIKAKCPDIDQADVQVDSEYLIIESALATVSHGKLKVLIHNPTYNPIDLQRNQHVGVASIVTQQDILPIDKLKNNYSGKIQQLSPTKQQLIAQCKIDGPKEFQYHVRNLLQEFADVISENKQDLGRTNALYHQIRMKSKEPVHLKQFRIPEEHLKVLNDHVSDLLSSKCIELSKSPYNSPIFCVKKPGGGLRIVQDFRKINDQSYDDLYSLKEIKECIDNIGRLQSTTFSTLDLTSGFWQVPIHEDSREQTAFTVPGRGRYHWLVTAMGLKGAPATFQRLMDYVMRELIHIQCYIDDLLVHSKNWQEHLKHLRECLIRLRQYNLKINLSKCAFGRNEVPYLGHVLTPQGVKPSVDKLKAVKEFPEPTTVKKLREFCGLTNYFRAHIKNFALLAGQLTKLTRKDSTWKSGPLPPASKAAFNTLKSRLCDSPVLAYPLPNRHYTLSVDAATGCEDHDGGLGAILSQIDDNGQEKVVAFASRSLTQFEKNYTPFLLEMAAACWAIDHFHVYLYGRKFTLLTDHRPVEKMSRLHQKTLNRLQQQMLQYNFVVVYRPGSENEAADALSRNPVDSITQAVSRDDLIAMQRQDPLIGGIIAYLEEKFLPVNKQEAKQIIQYAAHCYIKDKILHFLLQRRQHENKMLLFVPPNLRLELIHACHASRFAGHGGADKTVTRLQQKYYWPGMTSDASKFVQNCLTCQRCRSPRNSTLRAPLTPIPIPDAPNERVHVDLMGPLRTSSQGNKMVLVITDAFTKYTICVAIPNKEAKTVAEAIFKHYITIFSVPRIIVSDQGKEFSNDIMDELCVLLGVDKRRTAAMHPATNSAAESFNRSFIKFMTRTLDGQSTLDWEEQLPALMISYNTQVHKSTLNTPFYLTFLHPPNLPFYDLAFEDKTSHSDSWATETFQNMQRAYRLARKNAEEARISMKQRFDQRATRREFKVGDDVLVHFPKHMKKGQPHGNSKFMPEWHNGYKIERRVAPDTYIVRKGPHGRPSTVQAERLKLLQVEIHDSKPEKQKSYAEAVKQQPQNRHPMTTRSRKFDTTIIDKSAKQKREEVVIWISARTNIQNSAQEMDTSSDFHSADGSFSETSMSDSEFQDQAALPEQQEQPESKQPEPPDRPFLKQQEQPDDQVFKEWQVSDNILSGPTYEETRSANLGVVAQMQQLAQTRPARPSLQTPTESSQQQQRPRSTSRLMSAVDRLAYEVFPPLTRSRIVGREEELVPVNEYRDPTYKRKHSKKDGDNS